jgi:hypothetical protein
MSAKRNDNAQYRVFLNVFWLTGNSWQSSNECVAEGALGGRA